MDERLVDELTREVLERFGPAKLWEWNLSCQGVCVERNADSFHLILDCGAERIGVQAEIKESSKARELSRHIDHTLLKANATEAEIRKLCEEGREYGFASVCVNPNWVRLAASLLRETPTKVCAVVGFPLGASTTDVKAFEARRVIFDGATEVDMVINVGALKSGWDQLVEKDIGDIVRVCHDHEAICKVILETGFLEDDEKVRACQAAVRSGADFVKTSTGFGPAGATLEDVRLMRRTVGPTVGVKAAGGIKGLGQTRALLEAGATRIGASAGVRIVQEQATSGDW